MSNSSIVGAIIQARMGSTRLPGKTMMEILKKPMLWHLVNRLKSAKRINKIIVATTTSKKDDVIEKFCRDCGINTYRGDENDVLGRYYRAAKVYNIGIIVRITSDCPLIDPAVADKVISNYLRDMRTFSGASNVIKRTYPRGLDTEVFSFLTLKKTWENAKDEYQREHLTSYIYEHPELFKLLSVEHDEDLSNLRWTIDEEEDFRFVDEVYKRLYKSNEIFLMEDVLKLLKKEPHLGQINKDIKQKPAKVN